MSAEAVPQATVAAYQLARYIIAANWSGASLEALAVEISADPGLYYPEHLKQHREQRTEAMTRSEWRRTAGL